MSEVLIILTNFSRPQNMSRVIEAWREQTVKCKIVVVDNRPKHLKSLMEGYIQEEYPGLFAQGVYGVDDVWRWTENSGCPCWLAPATMLYGHKYVLRSDDDFLPGKRAVEHLLATAEKLNDEFSTIGQIGRVFDRSHYHLGNAHRLYTIPTRVDLTCRVSFMRSEVPISAILWRNMLLSEYPSEETSKLVGIHDDFLICCGAQKVTGYSSYVIAKMDDPETELIKEEIPNGPESCYKRPGHYQEREAMVQLCVKAGWRSLV